MISLNELTKQWLNIDLSAEQEQQFEHYQNLLLNWNQYLNLTRITEHDAIQMDHFLDSLSCSIPLGMNPTNLIDIGAGAGFPGIPLKIIYPDLQLTLLETAQKKANFLEVVVEQLQLSNVTVFSERAEAFGQNSNFREQFDWAVARAVAPLNVLAEYLLPYVKIGGSMIALKGAQTAAELTTAEKAITTLGGGTATIIPLNLPPEMGDRSLIRIPKINPTPSKYPRRPGMPQKRPIT